MERKEENMEKENQIEKQSEVTEAKKSPEQTDVPEAKQSPEQATGTHEVKSKETKETKEVKQQEESTDVKVDVDDLKRQLAEAIETGKQVDALTTTVEQMKADVEAKDNIIREYEGLLQNLVETKLEQIPDQYKDLVPDNMDLKQKLSWLEKAESKGLFNKEDKQNPALEVGKPMNVEVPKVDTTKMSASSLLSMAYNTIKK